jgi:hypothetical protein
LGFSLVAADMNLAKIKQALGHKNIASIVIYGLFIRAAFFGLLAVMMHFGRCD